MGCIYRIYHKESGKSYIGQTIIDPKHRIKSHLNGNGGNQFLTEEINKHGVLAFEWEIICEVSDALINALEICYIKVLNTLAPNGYNAKEGGNGATKESIRKRQTKPKNHVYKFSPESRQKMSERTKERTSNPEYRRQASEKMKAYWRKQRRAR